MLGFDMARTCNPPSDTGKALALANLGGFTGSTLTIAAMGILLDLREPRGLDHYGLDDFRLAMSAQFVLWAIGVTQIVRYRGRVRRAG